MQTRLVVVGAGGHGSEVMNYIQSLVRSGWDGQLLGFLDDGAPLGPYRNVHVLGGLDCFAGKSASEMEGMCYLTALGNNFVRRKVVETLQSLYGDRMKPWTLMHPDALVGDDVGIGVGTCVAPGVIFTCRATVGEHSIVNVKASVSHDCEVGHFVNLNPGVTICGNVSIGDGAYIGAGTVVIDKRSIGRGAIIGAGAVVVDDIPPDVTAVGVPARVIKQNRVVF